MHKKQKDVLSANCIKDEVDNIYIHEDEVAGRQKYFLTLLDLKNANDFDENNDVEGPLDDITMAQVSMALDSSIMEKQQVPLK